MEKSVLIKGDNYDISGIFSYCFTVGYDKKFKNFSKYVKKARQNKYFNNLQNQKILGND